jgi:ATP adenylyltransferase/5',5'''-P-1,P-4-tetraphosphate phosphorylase II
VPLQALLVTSEWQAQTSPLSSDDLDAWAWTLDRTSSVGFYNSDRAAGASQTHKHMQMVPLETIAKLRGTDAKYVCTLPRTSMLLLRHTASHFLSLGCYIYDPTFPHLIVL